MNNHIEIELQRIQALHELTETRLYESLGCLAPSEFAKKSQKSKRPELV